MTPDQTSQAGEEQNSEKEIIVVPDRDYVLQGLVDDTNMFPSNTIGITLQMSGILVSGIIIAGDEYYARFADENAKPGSDVHQMYVSQGDRYKKGRETEDGKEQRAAIGHTAFIHLKDCNIWQGGLGGGIEIRLWRGRIAAVDAFWRGILQRTNNK